MTLIKEIKHYTMLYDKKEISYEEYQKKLREVLEKYERSMEGDKRI
jgi:hypothetical protein